MVLKFSQFHIKAQNQMDGFELNGWSIDDDCGWLGGRPLPLCRHASCHSQSSHELDGVIPEPGFFLSWFKNTICANIFVLPNCPTSKMVSSTNLVSSCHDSKLLFMQIFLSFPIVPWDRWCHHTWYLSFFLHGQNFWRIKFTPKNANFSR